jgi:hypothetical protein
MQDIQTCKRYAPGRRSPCASARTSMESASLGEINVSVIALATGLSELLDVIFLLRGYVRLGTLPRQCELIPMARPGAGFVGDLVEDEPACARTRMVFQIPGDALSAVGERAIVTLAAVRVDQRLHLIVKISRAHALVEVTFPPGLEHLDQR